ncbi:unnamed protein product [marine sediment metagenome]|uniref:DUF2695 domain-containing protein n=1 Tax=marine sediment metagenome TaxID=412755 RepID=X1C8J3_9ZZZZ
MPDSIGDISSLKKLNLWRNKLSHLPDSIGKLNSLQSLQLEENNLKNLPDSLINMSSLEGIVWDKNPLSKNNQVLRNLATKGIALFPMVTKENEYPFDEIAMNKGQIRDFLLKLAGPEGCQFKGANWRCGGKEFKYSRKILKLMKIPKREQDNFLKLCKELGGFCDCEILMNAAEGLLGEETPW